MNRRNSFIILIVLFLGFGLSIYQYSETFKTEIVSATSTVPNPGHTWASMECNSDSLCIVSNKLGIGTAIPTRRLTVMSDGTNTENSIFGTSDWTTSTGSALVIRHGATTGNTYTELLGLSSGWGAYNNLILQTAGGKVGIGTTTPAYKLDVNGDTSSSNFHDSNGVYNVNLGGDTGRGLAAGYSGGSYGGIGYNIRHTTTSASYIAPFADTVSYIRFTVGGFEFLGAPTGAAGRTLSLSSLMTISNSGNVGIAGTVSGTYFNGPLYERDVRTIAPSSELPNTMRFGFTSWANNSSYPYADYLHFRSYSDSSGGNDNLLMISKSSIAMRLWQQSSGSSTAYSSYSDVTMTPGSDIRLKKEITPITDALDKTLKLTGVNFNWNDAYLNYFGKEDNSLQMGLIAQDVEKVVPEVVLHNKIGITGMNDVLSIDYGRLSALLIESTKEQQKQIESLASENKELKLQVNDLKSLVCSDHPLASTCK